MNKRNRLNLSLPPTGNEVQRQEEPAENEPVLDDQLERLTLTLPQPQVERIPEWILQKQRIAELNEEVLERLCELGYGNSGVVHKMRHRDTDIVLARKLVHLEVKPSTRNQILREVDVLHKFNSPYIVGFYGIFTVNSDISICMEFMDGLSLDKVLKTVGRMEESKVGRVAVAVVKGLAYLKEEFNILHRDIKPSNMLVNSSGEIKLCDFGVSTTLTDSMANTFVGTRSYMAPEKLLGGEYSVESDVWSFGLSLVELVVGHYPIPALTRKTFAHEFGVPLEGFDMDDDVRADDLAGAEGPETMATFEFMWCIVHDPPPVLPRKLFTEDFREFIGKCLKKNATERANHTTLMKEPFFIEHETNDNTATFDTWVRSVIET
ncbi:MAPK proteinK protein [Aphelenchoides avenae]|nr:MAPK proteinK protein [Aphelenchus avenae]